MTICLPTPRLRVVRRLPPINRTISTGTSTVDKRKARPRIFSRYSRLAINRTLRGSLSIGFASHGADEYLFERGLNQFEPVDGGAGRGFAQQLLRVSVRLEEDLRVAGEVFCLRHFVARQKTGVAFELDIDAIAFVAAFDLAHCAAENRFAFVDQADGVTELFDLVHAVRGEENGAALCFELEQ